MHKENIITAGTPVAIASKALIMLHGRGASAEDILSLAQWFPVGDYALLAPQATNHTWYPQSFLAPPAENEPWLSSALSLLKSTTDKLLQQGIAPEHIYFLGFSQGACLTLEFIARNAARYGGAVAFTGGLIGDRVYSENYNGAFDGMPVFIGSSNPDFHVPVQRVHESTAILQKMGARVTEKIYDNMGHTIIEDEIRQANELIFS
ncbi:phospholipase/carboxylesterase [Chitinophaga polysaccharea]|uniref:Phospholipase/carboxylesterase n=1 Tax=Chitinophaga polysaccharea TaxID=1293035 RepID=A0A561PB29_9BACT|nr:dienelactone hydrolase family protein [Chitinophaga polysaccharea]TWF35319.1 phospholipase/carboxylesterase [Chitinophaga polysaccharea]